MKRWAGRHSTFLLIVGLIVLALMGGAGDHIDDLDLGGWGQRGEYSKP